MYASEGINVSHNENRKFSQQLLKQWAGLDIQICVMYICNSCACVMLGRGGRREEGGRLSQCSRCAGRGPLTGLCTSSHSEVALSTNLPSMNN